MKDAVIEFLMNPATLAGLASFIFGVFAKKGWTLIIKKFAAWSAMKSKEAGEALLAYSSFAVAIDHAIKEDGGYVENSMDELKATGKVFVKELKDNFGNTVVVTVEPKKITE